MCVGNPRKQPLQDLPVPADPAMLAPAVRAEVRRIVVNQLELADQARPRINSLDQVVTQNGVGGKTIPKNLVKNFHLVDSLSGKDRFAEQILVDVGNGMRIDVQAGFARIEVGEARAIDGLDTDADPRLQDAVTGLHRLRSRIDDRAVERVRHGTDQMRSGATRQLRVGIESDHIFHAAKLRNVTGFDGEPVLSAKNEFVQIEQLTPLALPSHPGIFPGVETTVAMKMKKPVPSVRPVFAIQTFNQTGAESGQIVLFIKSCG